ncbi:MAG: MATE family efflux transporter [Synergistaceae bacterium]|nr:MATE family efflux transporter [Synergistaceae bacterium]
MEGKLSQREIEIFETMPAPRAVAALAVPSVISQLILVVYNLADTWYIGQLNDTEMMAAVTLSFPVFLMLTALANLFGIGGASLLSRSLGEHNYERARAAGASSAWLAAAITLAWSLAVMLWRVPLLRALGADAGTIDYASGYLFWTVVVGGLPTVMNMLLAHLIRAEGASREASVGMSIGGLLNILLDPLFIYDQGLGMGIEGAAVATCISNAAAALYLLRYLFRSRKENVISLSPRYLSLKRKVSGDIIFVGLPSSIQFMMSVFSNAALNYLMAAYTASALSAVGIVKKVDMVPTHVVQGICSGVIPLMAYNYASGSYGRLWRCVRIAGLCSLGVTLSYLALCESFAPLVIRIFIDNSKTVEQGAAFLRMHCMATPFLAIFFLIVAFFQATGRGTPALFLSFLRKGALDIPFMAVMNIFWPMYGIMAVQPMMDFITAAVCLMMYRLFQKSDGRKPEARESS